MLVSRSSDTTSTSMRALPTSAERVVQHGRRRDVYRHRCVDFLVAQKSLLLSKGNELVNEAMLYRKGKGKEAKLAYLGHVLLDNRQGLGLVLFATRHRGQACSWNHCLSVCFAAPSRRRLEARGSPAAGVAGPLVGTARRAGTVASPGVVGRTDTPAGSRSPGVRERLATGAGRHG